MLNDSITEEIRGIRRSLAARFENDIARIFSDVRQQQAVDGRVYVAFPKRAARTEMAEPATAREAAIASGIMSESHSPPA